MSKKNIVLNVDCIDLFNIIDCISHEMYIYERRFSREAIKENATYQRLKSMYFGFKSIYWNESNGKELD